jgi:hypothetical protein
MKKNAIKKAAEIEKPPYPPTPYEAEAGAAYAAAQSKKGPRLKVTNANVGTKIELHHPDLAYGQLALMKAIGTTNAAFFEGRRRLAKDR